MSIYHLINISKLFEVFSQFAALNKSLELNNLFYIFSYNFELLTDLSFIILFSINLILIQNY